ncbi:MAG: leucine-rich repeat domain-containing protein, partial [Kiritimatiellaeota bacterium]|nr:leucine-rich repeat domain-containing protein [Kiritimatiellota bacterium]
IIKGYFIEDITSPTPSREGGVLGDFHVMATSLTLPQAEISAFAFYACTNLTGTLSIPRDWKIINIQTFFRCNKLDALVFEEPSSMQIIGDDAFNDCSRLSGKLFLPDTVYSIGTGTFAYTGFTEISTPSSGATFGSNAFYTQDPALNAVCYRGNYPYSVASSLYELNGNVTSYVALASVNSWNPEVSDGPIQNGNATWRGRPIRLYDWYFETPTVLASPTGWKFQVQDMGAGALWVTNCIATPPSPSPLNFTGTIQDACTIVNVGNNGTVAGAGALFNVNRSRYLTHLTLAATTTNIGNYAFYFCTNLTGMVAIPNAVKAIGNNAFQSCTAMTGLTFAAPASLQTIGNSAFSSCTNLTGTVAIPNTVRDIGNSAFYNCAAMTGLTLGTLGGALTNIGNNAFLSCINLTGRLTLPDAVRNIGDYAFSNTRLTEISTPSTGATFGNYAFLTSYPELNAVCYRGGYPDSVGTFPYNSSGNVTSYVLRAHAANWDANADGLTGAPIEDGHAT